MHKTIEAILVIPSLAWAGGVRGGALVRGAAYLSFFAKPGSRQKQCTEVIEEGTQLTGLS
jgi:hypothetical protein